MSPENVVRLVIGGFVLLGTLASLGFVPKDKRAYLTPFGVIGCYFVVSGLLP